MTSEHETGAPQRSVGPDNAPVSARTGLPETRVSRSLDAGLVAVGHTVSWLWLVVIALILWAVARRYIFNQGSIAVDEMQWHIASAVWLIGLSYTVVADEHVRVDILYERLGLRAKAWVELLGIGLLLIPFLVIAVREAAPFALDAWRTGERSSAPAGLGARWVPKAIMAVAFTLLLAAALSRLSRVTSLLFGRPRALPAREDR